jgi:F-type H+-transporting ATPase subunit delta
MKINKRSKREAKRLFRICLVDGLLDEGRIRQVVNEVAAGGHRDRLAILAHLLRLVKLDRAQHTAEIESAIALPPDLQSDVCATLMRRFGPGLATTFIVSPSLIGGMRIKVGSDVYDGSVRAGLAALEKSF